MLAEEKQDLYLLMCGVFDKTFPRPKSNDPKEILDRVGGIPALEKLLQLDEKTVPVKVTKILTRLCDFPNICMLVVKSKPLRRHLVLLCDNLEDKRQLASVIVALGNMCRLLWKPKYFRAFQKLDFWKKILNVMKFGHLSEEVLPAAELHKSFFEILVMPARLDERDVSPGKLERLRLTRKAILGDLCDKHVLEFLSNYLVTKPKRPHTGMVTIIAILCHHGDPDIVAEMPIFSTLRKIVASSPQNAAEIQLVNMWDLTWNFTHGTCPANRYVEMEVTCSPDRLSCDTNGCGFTGWNNQLQVCGGCLSSRYCSRACQKRDWKTHKKVCKKLKNSAKRK